MNDDQLRKLWTDAGGRFHGPNVETGYVSESLLLPFLRTLRADFHSHTYARAGICKVACQSIPKCQTTHPCKSLPEPTESTRCQSNRDGDCVWSYCPQMAACEPEKTGRHCPLDTPHGDDE